MPLPLASPQGSRDGRGAGTRAQTAARRQRTQLKANQAAPPTPHPLLQSWRAHTAYSGHLRGQERPDRQMGAGPNAIINPGHAQDRLPGQQSLPNAVPQRATRLPHLVPGLVYITETAEEVSDPPSPALKHGCSRCDPDRTLAISIATLQVGKKGGGANGLCHLQDIMRAQDSRPVNAQAAPAPRCADQGSGFSLHRFPPGSTGSDPRPGEA